MFTSANIANQFHSHDSNTYVHRRSLVTREFKVSSTLLLSCCFLLALAYLYFRTPSTISTFNTLLWWGIMVVGVFKRPSSKHQSYRHQTDLTRFKNGYAPFTTSIWLQVDRRSCSTGMHMKERHLIATWIDTNVRSFFFSSPSTVCSIEPQPCSAPWLKRT